MPQVKKTDMKDAMLAAAFELFSRRGYAATTLAEIARNAGTTAPNLYVYFDSKLHIVYEIYEPWLLRQLDELAQAVMKLRDPRSRLRRLVMGIWSDIPSADRSFGNVLIEALAGTQAETRKPRDLLDRIDVLVTDLLLRIVPEARAHVVADRTFSRILWMAFDGFSINQRLGQASDLDRAAELMVQLVLGDA
ncbi:MULTISPECIES: TetR/AcrR family transcriptional regulator [unclassified Achromobacter]|uniref:TetR/AcrR family transcriptional regulator n=1 Tax=unclassified Achromobacter TaxID=2626865 RepID=UPI000B518BE5|nr:MULTISPECIES: TetR/AcrR family transcriptional regulator [unclassified Achromobacter]OWT80376.1 TetR family transcriptional regulator [Achromobacter sp. HZ34]OWT82259.1 TetR family transcriptional regulator [Achromobacter sp. HZ28]